MGKLLETFDVEVVVPSMDGIKRPYRYPKATGIIGFDALEYIRGCFEQMAKDNGGKVKLTRNIHMWCGTCGAYCGYVPIKFKQESFRRDRELSVSMISEVHTQRAECSSCFGVTYYSIQDPIMTTY